MYQEEIKVNYGEGRNKIFITSLLTQEGISVTITGGEKPHVGGVAVSVPRKSLRDNRISCDTWITPVPGHKDTEVAAPFAQMICLQTGKTVAVVAGIHIENATDQEIARLVENSMEAARLLIEQIKSL